MWDVVHVFLSRVQPQGPDATEISTELSRLFMRAVGGQVLIPDEGFMTEMDYVFMTCSSIFTRLRGFRAAMRRLLIRVDWGPTQIRRYTLSLL